MLAMYVTHSTYSAIHTSIIYKLSQEIFIKRRPANLLKIMAGSELRDKLLLGAQSAARIRQLYLSHMERPAQEAFLENHSYVRRRVVNCKSPQTS